MSDALGTVAGACLGTSTVTTYMESCTGIAQEEELVLVP